MSLYPPEQAAAHLASVLADATLVGLLPGGVHETDATESSPAGTATRRTTPYLVYSLLAGTGEAQGAGGTVLFSGMDWAILVFHRPSEVGNARAALRRVATLLEGTSTEVATSGDIDAHAVTVRAAGPLPRLPRREPGGALTYSEGSRWRIYVQRT